MQTTSRAILQTLLASDPSLSAAERRALERLLAGDFQVKESADLDQPLLVTQQKAAYLLSVSRVTIYRMTKAGLLHPVEILPGTLRYPFREVVALAAKEAAQGES